MFSYSYGGWKSSARQNKTTGAILVKEKSAAYYNL